jgi:hypothetical protein
MRTYAHVENGVVAELVTPGPDLDGNQYDLELCFPKSFVDACIEITGLDPIPGQRWTYDGTTFSAPVPYQPTAAEIKASNTSTRDYLLGVAALTIAPLQDAADLDEATAQETALLKSWKQYRVAVNRIDLTLASPAWPVSPA